MLSRRVPSPGVLRYPFSRRILHAQRDSESESVKITMPARSEAPSLDALDLENGEWNDVKPQRGTRLVRRLLACQVGGKSVGWIALTVLQTIVIFVLLIYLHRSAVAIESPDRYGLSVFFDCVFENCGNNVAVELTGVGIDYDVHQ